MENNDEIRAQLEAAKKERAEIAASLAEARDTVTAWMDRLIQACQRERWRVHDGGDIIDGEIDVPWNLLQEAIGKLRDTQDAARDNGETIRELEWELHEFAHLM